MSSIVNKLFNRDNTNKLRLFFDNSFPKVIRDNKFFVYPLFLIWFQGENLDQRMNFKSIVKEWGFEEYKEFYRQNSSLAQTRMTDLNKESIQLIIENLKSNNILSIADIGCGKGYLVNKIKEQYPNYSVTGADLFPGKGDVSSYQEIISDELPFEDKKFDITISTHTLEHVLKPEEYVAELKRITKDKLIVVVPKQKYFYYTLDEHLNFFETKDSLIDLMNLAKYECFEVSGDWFYIGYLD